MTHVYLSGDWHQQGAISSTSEILQQDGVKLFDWRVFNQMDLKTNSIKALEAIRQCRHYAAILDNPGHRYQGTFELMAVAISLGKPVSVFVPVPRNPGKYKGERMHQFRTEFDRFWLYHPSVKLFVGQEEYDAFVQSLKN